MYPWSYGEAIRRLYKNLIIVVDKLWLSFGIGSIGNFKGNLRNSFRDPDNRIEGGRREG